MASSNRKSSGGRLAVALVSLLGSSAAVRVAGAAVELPARNPRAGVSQDVGLTHIDVRYARLAGIDPAALPAGQPLRGRDDPSVRIAFSRDVALAGANVPAGEYALVVVPGGDKWTLVLYRDAARVEASRAPHPELEQARVGVVAAATPSRDRLTVLFSDVTSEKASLDLEWSGVRLSLPITAGTRAQILSEIRALDGVSARYARAARYLLDAKEARKDGLLYARRARALDDSPENRALEAAFVEQDQRREPRGAKLATTEVRVAPASGGGPGGSIALAASVGAAALDERAAVATAAQAPRRTAPGPSEIAPVVKRGRRDIEACYQRALRHDPGLPGGHVDVSISVSTTGRVKSVTIDAPTALGGLEECLRGAVARWPFPASSADYETQIPLSLRAQR